MTDQLIEKNKLLSTAAWIMRRPDLPQDRAARQYKVQPKKEEAFVITLANRPRQVIDALRKGPLYCASPIRLSDVVHIVKRDHGINIETVLFQEHANGETNTFGIYVLRDEVTPANIYGEVAA